jgi:iron(III) transport system substrate-binding protein
MSILFFSRTWKKRGGICFLRFLLICIVVVFLGSVDLYASQDQLKVAAAEKEGKVVFYTAMSVPEAVNLQQAFEAKYPKVKVQIFRLRSQGILTKVIAEHRAKKDLFDVVNVNVQIMNTFKANGILGKYFSPERKVYPELFKEPDGHWTGIYYNVGVIVHNTKMVSSQDAPKTYEDLMDPKWRGKIMMNRLVVHWFAGLIEHLGREKAVEMCQRLADNDLVYRDGGTLVLSLVVAGEVPVGFPLYGYSTNQFVKQGAPVYWHRPEPPFISPSGMGISSKPPHPNAAKLFVDFILSEEGQNEINEFGKDPTRPGIKHASPRLIEGLTFSKFNILSPEEYKEVTKIYRSIFKIAR